MIRGILVVAVVLAVAVFWSNLICPPEERRVSIPGCVAISQVVDTPTVSMRERLSRREDPIAAIKTKIATTPTTPKIKTLMDPNDRPDIARSRRAVQRDTVEPSVVAMDVVPYLEPETEPAAVDTPPISEPATPPFDPALADEAPDKLSRMVGHAFLIIHTPDTFQIPPSWKGADVAVAALQDALWSENAGHDRGWAVKDGLGRKFLVPKTVLARIVSRLEEKYGGSQAPLYRVDVFLNTEDIVDVRVEYF